MRAWIRNRLGVLLAGATLASVFGIATARGLPLARAWSWFGVEHEGIAFLDLAMITGAADCVARGIDPYLTPSCDVLQRPYNYPPIMLLLTHLGLRKWHTVPLGLALDVAFFTALAVVLKARSRVGQVIIFLAVLSYPVLWALQRGNVDLVVFVGCVAACLLLGKGASWRVTRHVVAGGIVLVLFLAKLYPVAASTAFWRDRRSILAASALATIAVAAYVASDASMFAAVRGLTPFMTERSYGVGVLAGLVYFKATDAAMELAAVPPAAQVASYVLSASTLAGALLMALRHHKAVGSLFDLRPSLAIRLALVGVSIYCLTYCLGTNFNYRLSFLTLAVPYFLSGWEQRRSSASLVMALATVAFLWLKWQTHDGFAYRPDELRPLFAEAVGFILFWLYAVGIFSVGLYHLSTRHRNAASI